MRWDYLFNKQIVQRGQEYFLQGRVKNLIRRGATCQAEVVGSERYQVEIYLNDRVHPKMFCDCPYAEDGGHCKHMAAVLCAVEESEKQSGIGSAETGGSADAKGEAAPKRVYPFSEEPGDYEYFDLAELTKDFYFFDTSLKKAEKMISSGRLKLDQLQTGYPNKIGANEMIGIACGSLDGEAEVRAVFDRTKIQYATCMVKSCYCSYHDSRQYYGYGVSIREEGKEKLCPHILGTLLLAQQKLRNEAIGDATDNYARRMLMDFRSLRAGSALEQEASELSGVKLEPVLEQENEMLQAGFKIGRDKLYVVKNLPELVETVENAEKLSIGTKGEIDFAGARITGDSEGWYRFIRDAVMEEVRRGEHARENYRIYENTAETIKGKLPLYGRRLDRFFELAVGKTFEFTEKNRRQRTKGVLRLEEADPQISLTISGETDERGVFQGVRLKGAVPELIQGVEYQYYMEKNTLNRINPEKSKNLRPILELAENNRISVQIGRRYLSEFYYRVLPALREQVSVREKDAKYIRSYLPPEVEFVFYLDEEEKNITCKPQACYGETVCNVADWLREDARKELYRDRQREGEVLNCVKKLFPEADAENGLFRCAADADTVYRILESGVPELLKLGDVQSTDRFRRLRIRKNLPVTVGVSVNGDLLNLEIGSEELTKEELLDILYHYQRKKKFYRLKNGDFLSLEEPSLEELAQTLEALHVSPKEFVQGKMQLPLYRALYLDKMLEQCDDIYSNRDSHFKQLIKNFKTVEDSDYELPKSLASVMRKYQKHGYRWLRTLESFRLGGILADDMGLGKTLQVIAVLLSAKQERGAGETAADSNPALIVTPASLVYNWQEEFARFAPELSVCVVAGNQTARRELIAEYRDHDVLVTSYDLLKRDIAEYEGKQFSYQVIDEAQYIKNHTTAAAKSVKIIQSRVKFALTGTPIENRLSELWSIFDYLMPGFLYGYDTFKKEFETPIVKNRDEGASARLKRMVSPFILRRLKGDVLKELPEKLEETYYAQMAEKQQQLYDGQLVRMRGMLEKQTDENFKKNRMQILAEIMKLRQICCDPSLYAENYDGESAKRETCMELVRSAIEGEHKILLFSQFTSMLEILEQELLKEGISYYKITGETPKEKRVELVRAFNEDATPVFLISLKAGGTGLNLTGADIVIHYDPWWNLAVQNQATDRAHRIGQTKVVSVYKLIVRNSIEEKILHMQEEKKNLADEILSGENGSIVNMSREELLELLG